MKLCRFLVPGGAGAVAPAFHLGDRILPLSVAAERYKDATHREVSLPSGGELAPFLPPDGAAHEAARKLHAWVRDNAPALGTATLGLSEVTLRAPVPSPPKLLLLAGNYASHIEEGGGIAVQRAQTYPYVFMKPPSTTINHPGGDVPIPAVSPDHIDWEVELAVVIGRRASGVKEADALRYVAGYTIVNDISDRQFRPNPNRKERPNDSFFDWLHGKWHDGFCPMGPCILTADAAGDPQSFRLSLKMNGETMQDSTTAQQIFPVAAVIEFISSYVTLEPGDVISTGTPAGVGNARKIWLKPGDRLEATIDRIGTLENRMVAAKDWKR